MNKRSAVKILLISLSIMLIISSTAVLHANEAEFILDRFDGLSSLAYSLFDSILYAAYLIAGPMVGLFSARTGKRRPFVVWGGLMTAVASFSMTLVGSYPLLLAVRFIQGAACVFAWQSLMTMILDLSTDENRGRNMGIFGTFMALSMGLGPVVGGLLAGRHLFLPYYYSAAACIAAVLIAVFFVREPEFKQENIKPGLSEILLFVKKKPGIIVPALFNLVDRLHMGFIIFIIPLMLRELMHLGPEFRGMLLGINGSAYILLQYPVGRLSDRTGRYKLLLTGSIGYGLLLCFAGPAASAGLVPLGILFFSLGIFSGFTGPPNTALVGDIVSREENPLAMGFFNLFGNVGMVFGSLFGGLMLSAAGFTAAFIGAGLIELGTLVLNVYLMNRMKLKASLKNERGEVVA